MFKYYTLFLILIIFLNTEQANGTNLEQFCEYNPILNDLTCSNFTSLNQLNFTQTNKAYSRLIIKTDEQLNLVLDSSLDLDGLKLDNLSKIELHNLNGFNPNYNPFLKIKILNQTKLLTISIIDSIFNFTQFNCTLRNDSLDKDFFLFSDLNIDQFLLENVNFNHETKLCPLIFKNSRINKFIFSTINPIKYEKLDKEDDQLTLNITVLNLLVKFGYFSFLVELNNEDLLNEYLFNKIIDLELSTTYIKRIDGKSLENLIDLKRFKILDFNLNNLFKNGLEWLNNLNKHVSNKSGVVIKREDLFELTLNLDTNSQNSFQFSDEDFCLFNNYPFSNLIIPLLYVKNNKLSDVLPCTCTIYWLYKDFKNYSSLIKNESIFEQNLPLHCLEINPILINEQLDYCNNDERSKNCLSKQTWTELPLSTQITDKQECFISQDVNSRLCNCFLDQSGLNILECTNPLINKLPLNFSSINWNYVNFKGSTIKEISTNSFKSLYLKENATLFLSNVELFMDDIFLNDTFYDKKFRLVIENSILNSLEIYKPFRFTNFSQFEFKNCSFFDDISQLIFEGSQIDELIINEAVSNTPSPFFKTKYTMFKTRINKLKIVNVYQNWLVFGLDTLLLNSLLFENINELQITNSYLDFINSESLALFNELTVVKLENVNLNRIIKFYYEFELINYQSIDLNDKSINWLWNKNLHSVYLGHEKNNFEFKDDYVCYFAGISKNTTIYIYDTLDTQKGINCTCTIYWIYRNLNFNRTLIDYDHKYIPVCIKQLNNTENLNLKLSQCFQGASPLEFCKIIQMTTQEQGIVTSKITTTSELESTSTTTSIGQTQNQTQTQTQTFNQAELLQKIESLSTFLIVVVSLISAFILISILGFISMLYFFKKSRKMASYEVEMRNMSRI